jgi:hypothetical protein
MEYLTVEGTKWNITHNKIVYDGILTVREVPSGATDPFKCTIRGWCGTILAQVQGLRRSVRVPVPVQLYSY